MGNRSNKVLTRLRLEQAEHSELPHYDPLPGSEWTIQPDDIKTGGYWKLAGRRVLKDSKPHAYVVSGQGGKLNGSVLLTRWVPAYHISQTVEIKKR